MRIVIADQKGGTGKTTTAVTLSHALALRGFSVVLIDLDPQGNCSACLGRKPQPGLFDLLERERPLEEVMVEARDNLWLIPSDTSTAQLKNSLVNRQFREYALAEAIAPISANFIILDTAPSRDVLHDVAHMATNHVIIPVAVDHLALIGVYQEFESLDSFRTRNHSIEVIAILPTFYERRSNESAENLKTLANDFGKLVVPAIPSTVGLRRAPAYGQTLWEWPVTLDSEREARENYEKLVKRVLEYAKETTH